MKKVSTWAISSTPRTEYASNTCMSIMNWLNIDINTFYKSIAVNITFLDTNARLCIHICTYKVPQVGYEDCTM